MTEAQPILVAGGGMRGLATALGLAQAGFSALVLERAAELGEVGAGIQLGPNAFHALDALGVGAAARATAIYVERLRLMDALSADEICHIDLGEAFRARFANPYAVVHRSELHAILLRACRAEPRVALRTGAEVTGYVQEGGAVCALLADGEQVRGTALIGADGLWSRIRGQLVGDGPPRVSGHTTYRSVIPTEQMPEALRWNAATLWAGPKCHVVHYPLQGWKTFNLVVTCHDDAPEPVAGRAVPAEQVAAAFRHLHPLVRSIIGQGRDWRLWVLCDRDPVERWVEGRVAPSAMPRIRCCNTWRRAHAWRWWMRSAWRARCRAMAARWSRRWPLTTRRAPCARRAYNCFRARWASMCSTPPARMRRCAL
jgi:salicylate hydroxylase